MHESKLHECLKSSLAFRKPATAVASRRPAWADGLMVGLDGHASLSAGRAPWRDGQAFLPLRRRPEGNLCRRRRQNDAAGRPMSAADQPLIDGGTQWHRLSAAVKQPAYRYVRAASCSITAAHDHDNIGVTVVRLDGEVWSSADDAAIEPTCPGLAHSAQTGLLAHGWARHGRWCHDRAPSGARCAKAAIAFQLFVS